MMQRIEDNCDVSAPDSLDVFQIADALFLKHLCNKGLVWTATCVGEILFCIRGLRLTREWKSMVPL